MLSHEQYILCGKRPFGQDLLWIRLTKADIHVENLEIDKVLLLSAWIIPSLLHDSSPAPSLVQIHHLLPSRFHSLLGIGGSGDMDEWMATLAAGPGDMGDACGSCSHPGTA